MKTYIGTTQNYPENLIPLPSLNIINKRFDFSLLFYIMCPVAYY